MRRIAYEGTEYACPFEHAVRMHTAEEFAALEADILRVGRISYPAKYYLSPRWGYAIIDGLTRTTIAIKHGLPIDFSLERGLTDEEAEDRAKAWNYARRHFSREEQIAYLQACKEERLARVAEGIARGETLRTIAKSVGVSHAQVAVDAAELEDGGRKPKPPELKALTASRTLIRTAGEIMASASKRTRLRLIALGYNVPLSDDGRTWPALDGVAAAIRDL